MNIPACHDLLGFGGNTQDDQRRVLLNAKQISTGDLHDISLCVCLRNQSQTPVAVGKQQARWHGTKSQRIIRGHLRYSLIGLCCIFHIRYYLHPHLGLVVSYLNYLNYLIPSVWCHGYRNHQYYTETQYNILLFSYKPMLMCSLGLTCRRVRLLFGTLSNLLSSLLFP